MIVNSITEYFLLAPGSAVLSGDELPDFVIQDLTEIGVLKKDEKILYLYSDRAWSYKAEGNVVPNNRIISYEHIKEKKGEEKKLNIYTVLLMCGVGGSKSTGMTQ